MRCALVSRLRQSFVRQTRPEPPPNLAPSDKQALWPMPPRHMFPPHPGVRRSRETKVRDEALTAGWPLRTAIQVRVERNLVWSFLRPPRLPPPARPDSTTLGAFEPGHTRCDSELTLYEHDLLSDMVGDIDFNVPLTFKLGE